MLIDYPAQDMLLVLVYVDEQYMLARSKGVLKALKIVIGLLNTDEAALPGAETEDNDGKENRRYPGNCLGNTGGPGDNEDQNRGAYAHHRSTFCAVNNVFAQNGFDIVKTMGFDTCVILAEHMNLWSDNTCVFKLVLNDLKVIQVVADIKVTFHTLCPFIFVYSQALGLGVVSEKIGKATIKIGALPTLLIARPHVGFRSDDADAEVASEYSTGIERSEPAPFRTLKTGFLSA
jgi:hypothetical protein